mmetsp:Transcript_8948/g.19738  ORF Transcript_8948/g.19738 Transcript_8948/m.19738 type:complete len:226 (+) Transcript_8948:859-1536(+)
MEAFTYIVQPRSSSSPSGSTGIDGEILAPKALTVKGRVPGGPEFPGMRAKVPPAIMMFASTIFITLATRLQSSLAKDTLTFPESVRMMLVLAMFPVALHDDEPEAVSAGGCAPEPLEGEHGRSSALSSKGPNVVKVGGHLNVGEGAMTAVASGKSAGWSEEKELDSRPQAPQAPQARSGARKKRPARTRLIGQPKAIEAACRWTWQARLPTGTHCPSIELEGAQR